MTYLSWDESRTGVLEMAGFSRQGRDKPRETLGRHWGWRILDEFDPLFPPCIVCAGPGGRDGAEPDFVRSRPGTGAVAARGKPDTGARRIDAPNPGPVGHADATARRKQ